MKNLKKLLAVIVAVCVLATLTIPAFAAEAKTDAEICTALGIIKGTGGGVTPEYLAKDMARYQGAIMLLRLLGKEDEAKAFTGVDNFDDANKVNATNQAILAYLKANPDLGFVGIGNNKFDPLAKFTAKAYYKVLLTALGYEEGTDFTWANVFQFAASKGLYKLVEKDVITNEDLCVATVEALKAPVKGSTDTLIAKLVDGGVIAADVAEASGIGYTKTAKPLEIISATADTLKFAKIVFNRELDKNTVNKTNISASGVEEVKLADDNKTVIVKMADPPKAQDTSVDFTIENVKDTSGNAIAKVVKTIVFRDTTVPTVNGVVARNAKTLVISTSEPINYIRSYDQPLNSIKIDGNVAFGTASLDYVKNTITVKLYTALQPGTHKVNIADLTDYAGYKAVAQEFNIEVPEDTTAPEIVSGKMNNINEIQIEFNEDVEVPGSFWVDNVDVTSNVTRVDGSQSAFKIAVGELGMGAIVQIRVDYKGQKDVVGNEVKDKKTFIFKVDDDTALPTVTAKVDKGNKIILTFSKPMYSAGTIKILKASDNEQIGNTVTVTDGLFKSDTNKTVIELDASVTGLDDIDAVDAKINIKDMKDASVRKNELTEQNIPVKLFDTKEPVANNYKAGTEDGKDYVTFTFNEAMNTETIKNLSNFVITGYTAGTNTSNVKGSLKSLTDVSLKGVSSDNMSVSFYVPGINTVGGKYYGAIFTIYAVEDIAGNMLPSASDIINIEFDDSYKFAIVPGSVAATGKRKIEIEFTQKVKSIDYTAFEVRDASNKTIAYGGTGRLETPTKAAIDLYKDLPTTTAGLKVYLNNNKDNIKDFYDGKLVDISNTGYIYTLDDKIKPEVTVETGTEAGTIVLKFSEAVSYNETNVNTTSVGLLYQDLKLMKGSDTVDLSTKEFKVYKGDTLVTDRTKPFDKIVIYGLESGKTYTLYLYDNLIKDANNNKIVVVTAKEVSAR